MLFRWGWSRAVGRVEALDCACGLDERLHGRVLGARQVLHGDDFGGPQFRDEDLGDLGYEPVAIDRPIEHHGRDHVGHAQAGDQRGGLAVAVRECHPQPLAFRVAAVATGHVGDGPRFAHNTRRSGARLGWVSNQCPRRLRASGRSRWIACTVFFLRDRVAHEEAMQRTGPYRHGPLEEPRLDLNQGLVALLGNQPLDVAAMRLDPPAMPVPSRGLVMAGL